MSTDTPGRDGGPRTTDDPHTGLPEGVADDVLASDRRRTMLARLEAADGPVSVAALAAAVVAAETGTDPADVSPDRRDRVKEALYEEHVPTLTALRVADFDSRLASLTLAEAAPAVLDRWDERATAGELPGRN